MVFVAFPPDVASTPSDVKLLYQKVDDLIQKHIDSVTSPQTSGDDTSVSSISFVLLVIKTLTEAGKYIEPPILVRILQRLARDMGSSAGSHLRQGQRTDPDSAVSSRQGADLGAVISNLKSVLKLICEKVMVVPDCKRSVTQVLNALLSEKGTDAGMWIEDDFCKPGRVTSSGFISPKEIVSFLQKLSQVDKQSFSHDAHEDWDRKYLQLLYGICADSTYSLPLRQEPMITLLSKDYHKKQQASRPNVVQALLEGLQLSHPQPRMPSELIKYIGKTYNAWHIALEITYFKPFSDAFLGVGGLRLNICRNQPSLSTFSLLFWFNLCGFIKAVLNLQVSVEHSKEVSDCKNLIKTLVMGMKTIIWSITHAHLPRSQVSPSTHGTHSQVLVSPSSSLPAPQAFKGMREDEVWKASGVLKSGVHCLALFKEKDEERDMLNLFSQILSIMEPRDLMDMFSLCMPELFECMISNTQLVHIFSSLLQSSKVYRPFADVLVNFLACSKLDVLKNPDSPAAKLVLNLFRFIFGAVSKAPAEFERILQPHVLVIMEVCMKNATEVEKPLGYMQLLQTMFRALAGCKFDLLLRDLIPMLQPCLNMLLTMLKGPTGEDMRDLLLELCLTMPARLSSLLPHLPRLMRPLVLCLKGSDDLVSLGLSTLEFWVDSLNPDFLEPSMANVMSEVILSLWSHLRPAPYPWGGKALQLLGKLGGRNRCFLKEPLALECKDNPEHGLRLILTFEPSTPFLVPLDRCINLAVAAVINKSNGMDAFYRKQSLKFLCVCLSSQLNLPGNVSDEGCTARQLSTTLVSAVDSSWHRSEASDIKADLGVKTKTQLMAEKSVFKILLMTIIASNYNSNNPSIPIALGGPMLSSISSVSSRSKTSTNLKELDPLIFLDALVDVLSDDNRVHAKAALGALNVFAETVLFLARSKHGDALMSRAGPGTPMIVSSPSMNPFLSNFFHVFCIVAMEPQGKHRWGCYGCFGESHCETLCHFQVRIVRGLVYVLERLPPYASKEQEEASQVLTQVLRVVNNIDEANSEPRRKSFQGVVASAFPEFLPKSDVEMSSNSSTPPPALLGEESLVAPPADKLFNPNASIIVRKNVQSCLALLASRTGSEVSELLEPLYQPLLQPLITRPLRSKTVEQQVGIVTALNFCLALRPPLLKLTQELVNFLQEALQIAEADENVWVVKFVNPKYTLSLNKLRTSCIELLCTAMAWADFKSQNHSELRAKIISMFFKSLTCRTPEIVAVAKEGLRQVINQQRMPKELLQSSLRPILVNLAHTKNLSMPLLQGLARLLELLSSWFNVTLGGKLLEHLKKWMEPDKLSQSIKSWKAGEEPKIAAGALPSGQVYSELNSPYRLPLTKFLNRYATLAVDYFLARLNDPKYFRRFMYILRSDAGQPLRDELAKSPQKILASAFPEFLPKLDVEMSSNSSTPPPALLGEESLVAP
uniref:Non-specific serine/threonine protein kinase n=1 Tax=Salix viminalis TaxID=40686 RepID=A0A6N2NBL1_SALVM